MLKDRLLSFPENEDGYTDDTYPMNVMTAVVTSMMLVYHLTRKVMKIPGRWSLFISFMAAGFLLFLFVLWGIRDYFRTETILYIVEGVLAIGMLAGMAVCRVAEYIWKVPESGVVLAWITTICIIVPWLRWLFHFMNEGVIITIGSDPDEDISIQESVLTKAPEKESAVSDPSDTQVR